MARQRQRQIKSLYRCDLIELAIKEKGETNTTLAQKTGLSVKTVSNCRGGHSVNTATLGAIARALGLTLKSLFDFEQAA